MKLNRLNNVLLNVSSTVCLLFQRINRPWKTLVLWLKYLLILKLWDYCSYATSFVALAFIHFFLNDTNMKSANWLKGKSHCASVSEHISSLSWSLHLLFSFQVAFNDECKFKETLLQNNYNVYESSVYKGFYIAFSKHGRVKRGNRVTTAMTVTHFLPRVWADSRNNSSFALISWEIWWRTIRGTARISP